MIIYQHKNSYSPRSSEYGPAKNDNHVSGTDKDKYILGYKFSLNNHHKQPSKFRLFVIPTHSYRQLHSSLLNRLLCFSTSSRRTRCLKSRTTAILRLSTWSLWGRSSLGNGQCLRSPRVILWHFFSTLFLPLMQQVGSASLMLILQS